MSTKKEATRSQQVANIFPNHKSYCDMRGILLSAYQAAKGPLQKRLLSYFIAASYPPTTAEIQAATLCGHIGLAMRSIDRVLRRYGARTVSVCLAEGDEATRVWWVVPLNGEGEQ